MSAGQDPIISTSPHRLCAGEATKDPVNEDDRYPQISARRNRRHMPAAKVFAQPSPLIEIEELRPGGVRLAPGSVASGSRHGDRVASAPARARVPQRHPVAVSTCSSGKAGHETPTAVFVVLQKDAMHGWNEYSDAPMPNMNRLTWSGIEQAGSNSDALRGSSAGFSNLLSLVTRKCLGQIPVGREHQARFAGCLSGNGASAAAEPRLPC